MGRMERAKGCGTDCPSASGIDGAMFNTTSSHQSGAECLCLQARLISATHPAPTPVLGALFSRCVISDIIKTAKAILATHNPMTVRQVYMFW